ncbi:MAG TPA: IS3 family transposase, partial [Alphaproteobacteria bacterium]|nr:IS3 family transposase [Alphaproteobacteria bacterium]
MESAKSALPTFPQPLLLLPVLLLSQTQLSFYSRYRRLTALLVREGMAVNHKRVYRLYREEGLAMRIRQRRRIRWSGPAREPAARRPNEKWSMDLVSDCVSTGKVIRMLTVVDDCTRECP